MNKINTENIINKIREKALKEAGLNTLLYDYIKIGGNYFFLPSKPKEEDVDYFIRAFKQDEIIF